MEQSRRMRDGDTVLVQIGDERLTLQVISDRKSSRRLIVRSDQTFKISTFHSRTENRSCERPADSA